MVKMYYFVLCIFIIINTVISAYCETCTTQKNETGECVLRNECDTISKEVEDQIIFEDNGDELSCNITEVCCPIVSTIIELETLTCGFQQSDDYYRQTDETAVNEFPWLARIAYQRPDEDYEEYLCTGSLISPQYVLTAAHCISGDLKPTRIRLGEYHIIRNPDCIYYADINERECSFSVDFGIQRIIPHPNYDEQNNIHDIGLIMLNNSVRYSDYIRAICLPSPNIIEPDIGDTVEVSSWGWKIQPDAVFLVTKIKQKAFAKIITKEACEDRSIIVNAGQKCCRYNSKTKCLYETGGPLMFSYVTQWYQEGIALSKSKNCLRNRRILLYTKVSNYLDWIKENTKYLSRLLLLNMIFLN